MGCPTSSDNNQTPEVLRAVPYVENQDFLSTVPIETMGNKVFFMARINGKPYRFILDTGSPTMLTKKAADDLGLKISGQNTGIDANGKLVTMDLATLDRLTIGDVHFRNIPVFILDSSDLTIGNCFLDGGTIGAEILPLSNWQINFQSKALILTNDNRQLDYINGAKKAKLEVSGYPFYPILTYQINDTFKDNALFDTGNTELFHLNEQAFEALKTQNIVNSEIHKAWGVFGESAGGRGEDQIFHLVPIRKFSIGEVGFTDIRVWTRASAPSLIGSRILESQVVTLDYTNETIYFYQYKEPVSRATSFGFRPYFKEQSVYVGFLVERSPATEAGLRLHDQILEINQVNISHIENATQCDTFKWLSTLNNMDEIDIVFRRDGVTEHAVLQK